MAILRKFIFIILSFILIIPSLASQLPLRTSEQPCNPSILLIVRSEPVIDIFNNGNFSGYPGYGNSSHPFIIKDKIINGYGDICIQIENTDAFYIIENCTLFNGTNGIFLSNSINGMIRNNTIYNCTIGGIWLGAASNNKIINNTVSHSMNLGSDGIYVGGNSNNNLIANNTVFKTHYSGIYVNQAVDNRIFNNTVFETDLVGLRITDSYNTTLKHNTLRNTNDTGIRLEKANFTLITHNRVMNNTNNGIYLISYCNNNTIFNNTVVFNGQAGIKLWRYCHDNIIANNTIKNNDGGGIFLFWSRNNTISNNTCTFNGFNGITLAAFCDNNTITQNHLNNNTLSGIVVADSNNSTISFNTINFNDDAGLRFSNASYGIITWNVVLGNALPLVEFADCLGNLFKNNNFYYPLFTLPTVTPLRSAALSNFNFTVRYSDMDNKTPDFVELIINGTIHVMDKEVPSDNNFFDGCDYLKTLSLPKGLYNYSFRAKDGYTEIATNTFPGPLINNQPILTNYNVTPLSGSTLMNFTFSVNYTDTDNDPPSFIRLHIDNSSIEMVKEDGNDTLYTNGCIYILTTMLFEGDHNVSFETNDGFETVRTDNITAPTVNYNPTLTDGAVTPAVGDLNTLFTYFVNYADRNNDSPSVINVIINGIPFSMLKQNLNDTNYTDGCIFIFSTNLPIGSHNYFFNTSDGMINVSTEIETGPIVTPEEEPVISGFELILVVLGLLTLLVFKRRKYLSFNDRSG